MLRNLFASRVPSAADRAYEHAKAESASLIAKMRACSEDTNPIRAIMADIWAQNHNVPYVTAVFETVQEMNAPVAYKVGGADSVERKKN